MKTAKANRFYLGLFIAASICSGCGDANRQSQTLNDFVDANEKKLQGFYFYPSTVRMIGEILGAENSEMLSDIRQGRIFVLWDGEDSEIDLSAQGFASKLADEGFEMLISMRSNGVQVDAYELEGEVPLYLMFVNDPGNPVIVEIAGELSVKAIQDLAVLDFNKANELFNFLPKSEAQSEGNEPEETN